MSSEFGLRGPKTPWVCPSDRQLALRAKLKAGWSIKTNQFNTYPKPPPLTEKEQQAIVSVIRKAEELELNEQHRVGKLVDRLENLRRLASGNGITQCVLCGDSFGLAVFGKNSYTCCDCKKAVCRKCVVDLSGTGSGSSGGSGTGSTSSASSPSAKDGTIRLCKLCSENREFLKKSGAWFYKGIPKYVLPEKKTTHNNGSRKLGGSVKNMYQEERYMSRYIREPHLNALASTSVRTKRKGGIFSGNHVPPARSMSEQEADSSSSDEGMSPSAGTGLLARRAGSTRRAGNNDRLAPLPPITTKQPPSPTPIITAPPASPLTPGGSSNYSSPPPYSPTTKSSAHRSILKRLRSGGSKSSCSSEEAANLTSLEDRTQDLSDFSNSFDKSSISKQKSHDQTEHSPSSPFQLCPGDSNGARSSGSSFDSGIRRHPSMSSMRTTATTNSGSSTIPSPAAMPVTSSASTSSSSSTSSSISSYQRRPAPPPPPTAELGFGTLETSILFDDSHQALHCSIHRATDLSPMDIQGLSDPYCMLTLKPNRYEGTHLRTKTVHKTLHPVFNETLTFYGVTQNEIARQTLQIDVMDEDRWGRDSLGSVQVALHRIRPQQTKSFILTLEKPRLMEDKEWCRGRMLVSLSYITDKNLLLVGVIRAEGLPALDNNGTTDPFVKVKLLQDTNIGNTKINGRSINRKFNTGAKWKTVNPEFREEFSLKVSITELPKLALAISVIDRALDQNYIGGILLSTVSKGQRLKHWTDMLKFHNTKHLKWHALSPSMLPQ